jgi:hypothetical protein
MKKTLLAVVFFAYASLAGAVRAALMSPDPTGLWYDPDESGWGLSMTQQGDTLFAVLFVYGPDRAPAWYVASSLQLLNDGFGLPGGPNVYGTLYRTSGPWFGGTFDPATVGATPVGSLQVRYADADGKTLSISYEIGDRGVARTLKRQTWRDTRAEVEGRYIGELVMQQPASGCPAVVAPLPQNFVPRFDVAAGGAPGDIHVTWGTGIDTVCSIDGTYAQYGPLGSVSGYLTCGPVGNPGPPVAAQVFGITHNDWSMGAGVRFQSGSCAYAGHIGGVRIP